MRTKILIACVVFLLGIKFLIIPLNEHHTQLRDELIVLMKRASTTEKLLSHKDEFKQQFVNVSTELNPVVKSFQLATDSASYQLSFQQRWQRTIESNKLKLDSFNWTVSEKDEITGLTMNQAQLKVSGKLNNLIELHILFHKASPSVQISEMNLSDNDGFDLNQSTQMNLMIKTYYFNRGKE